LASAVLWIRSYRASDTLKWTWRHWSGTTELIPSLTVVDGEGFIAVFWSRQVAKWPNDGYADTEIHHFPPGCKVSHETSPPLALRPKWPRVTWWNRLGFVHRSGEDEDSSGFMRSTYWTTIFPLWAAIAPLALCTVVSTRLGVKSFVKQRRLRRGLCARCGF